MIRLLAAPRLALGVIGALVVYASAAVALPAADLGQPFGDHPFSNPPFLVLVALLFLSTLGCTWLRSAFVLGLWRGRVPAGSPELRAADPADIDHFLHGAGFRGSSHVRRRNAVALGAGWLLHVGLLCLMIGVAVQLAWHDSAAFEVAVGETVNLSAPGTVFGRSKGPLASPQPPPLQVELVAFDAHLHQDGYAPDRKSRLRLETPQGTVKYAVIDRVEGASVSGTTVFQVMPAGLALIIQARELGIRAIHLQQLSNRRATTEITNPAGELVRVIVDSEYPLDGRRGTGALEIRLENSGRTSILTVGESFSFGGIDARLLEVVRWSGFTYSRSPGMPAVFAGFGLVLLACTLLTIPAGVARLEEGPEGITARVWLNRGGKVLEEDWLKLAEEISKGETGVSTHEGVATRRTTREES